MSKVEYEHMYLYFVFVFVFVTHHEIFWNGKCGVCPHVFVFCICIVTHHEIFWNVKCGVHPAIVVQHLFVYRVIRLYNLIKMLVREII